jgi:hypothetical protein
MLSAALLKAAVMPKPILQAMVLADHVYQDRSGKHIIAGTFTTIFFGAAKFVASGEGDDQRLTSSEPVTRIGSPYLYLALVEVHGELPLSLKFVDLSDASVGFEAQIVVTARDPVSVAEYILPMPLLPANKVGNYSLDLLHEDELLGSWRIAVKRAEEQTP